MPIPAHDLAGLLDGLVLSASGEKIGGVGQIYVDDQSGEPTFVTAVTGLFGTSQTFVPLRGARAENGNVVVDFDKTTVKDAPRVDDDGSLSPAEEDRLYAYYGLGQRALDAADYGVADQVPVPSAAHAPLPTDDRPEAPGGPGVDSGATRPAGGPPSATPADPAPPGTDGPGEAAGHRGRLRRWAAAPEPTPGREAGGESRPDQRPDR